MFCLVLFTSQPLHAYTIVIEGDRIYTTVQSVVYKVYEGDVSGDPNDADLDKMTVFEFGVIGKIWNDNQDIVTLAYGECDSGATIVPKFDNFVYYNKLMEIQTSTCSNDMSISIIPELNEFAALGFVYLDDTSFSSLPKGEYDISFQIEGVPQENHGHSLLVNDENGLNLINDPVPKGWGIDTQVSFDLDFPYLILVINLFAIPIIGRFRNKI
ncbi:MAG: hypothetical protein HeimC2_25660 [Candidatus Heimdallarchaeota archaeon LC_2]|nr:MAG: hypothetical protein HeimC2_25660 [Candidatus Heimdallarchaeota archaeon LC_2]